MDMKMLEKVGPALQKLNLPLGDCKSVDQEEQKYFCFIPRACSNCEKQVPIPFFPFCKNFANCQESEELNPEG